MLLLQAGAIRERAPEAPALAPQQVDKAEAYRHFTMGRIKAEEGERSGAIEAYFRALKADPFATEIYLELTQLYYQSQPLEEVAERTRALVKAEPDNYTAHRLLATIYWAQLQHFERSESKRLMDEAIDQLRWLTQAAPDEPWSYRVLGELLLQRGDNQGALEQLQRHVELEPDSVEGVVALAAAFAALEQQDAAHQAMRSFLTRHPEELQVWMRLSSSYLAAGQLDSAIEVIVEALGTSPEDPQLHLQLGRLYLEQGEGEKALRELEDLRRRDPSDFQVRALRVQALKLSNSFEQAEQEILELLDEQPNNVRLRYDLADLYEESGATAKALSEFRSLLARLDLSDPDQLRFYAGIESRVGSLLYQRGDYEAAMISLESAIGHQAGDPRVWLLLGTTCLLAENYDKALHWVEDGQRRFPEEIELDILHADILAAQDRTDEALDALDGLRREHPDLRRIANAKIQILLRKERYPEAEQAARAELAAAEDAPVLYFFLGSALERQGRLADAEQVFRKGMELDAKDPRILNYLGYMFADNNMNLEEAQRLVERALEIDPDNGSYIDSLGWVHYRLGNFDKALELLERAVEKESESGEIYEHLGDCYAALGQPERAQEMYRKALEQDDLDDTLRGRIQGKLSAE
ncbi:MAG TPA: tetratricopeptide repeat protein [Acidobacteriota bacterium]